MKVPERMNVETHPAETESCPKRVSRVGCVVLLLLPILALMACWWQWDRRTKAAFAARVRAIRDAGEPVTLDDLAQSYPPLPASENGVTVLRRAFSLIERGQAIDASEGLPIVGQKELPDVLQPMPAEVLGNIRKCLGINRNALVLLQQGIGVGRFRFDMDLSMGSLIHLPDAWRLKGAVGVLALQAVERAEQRDAAGAAKAIELGIRLGGTLRGAPGRDACVCRCNCYRDVLRVMPRWLGRCRPSPDHLARVQHILEDQLDTSALDRHAVVERCIHLHLFDKYIFGSGSPASFADKVGGGPSRLLELYIGRMPKAWLRGDMCKYLDTMDYRIRLLRLPYPQSLLRCEAEAAQHTWFSPATTKLKLMSWLFLVTDHSIHTLQRMNAGLECARTALAVERFRAVTGALPKGIEELTPSFLKCVPVDPFDGKPLRYRAAGDGFVVYSVNRDGRDDAGREDKRAWYRGDIAFRRVPSGHQDAPD